METAARPNWKDVEPSSMSRRITGREYEVRHLDVWFPSSDPATPNQLTITAEACPRSPITGSVTRLRDAGLGPHCSATASASTGLRSGCYALVVGEHHVGYRTRLITDGRRRYAPLIRWWEAGLRFQSALFSPRWPRRRAWRRWLPLGVRRRARPSRRLR